MVAVETYLTDYPGTYKDVSNRPDQEKWRQAMEEETLTIKKKEVWTLAELPPGMKKIATRWVYQAKTNGAGHIEQYKA